MLRREGQASDIVLCVTRIQVQPQQQRGDERCPYCHDQVAAAERVTCASCGAPYHRECLHEELGACGIQGCGRRVTGARPDLIRVRLRSRELPEVGELVSCATCARDFTIRAGGRSHTLCGRCHARHYLFALIVILVGSALFAGYMLLMALLEMAKR